MKYPFEHSWAKVELFRWQYGCLPASDDFRPLDVPTGLRNMSHAIVAGCTSGDTEKMLSPGNVVSVLQYAAHLIESKEALATPSSKPKPKKWK